MDVRNLLFEAPLGRNKDPLFVSQLDLANALIDVPDGGFERKSAENVRIFINQVLKPPKDPRSRPVSRNLKRALPLAIAARIDDKKRAEAVAAEVMQAFDALKAVVKGPAHDALEWDALWHATNSKDVDEVVIVTANPAETQEEAQDVADLLMDALIDRVILRKGQNRDDPISYDFFVLSQSNADAMRNNLVRKVADRHGITTSEANDLVLDAQQDERLNIYFFDYGEYLPPMCIFEPNSNRIQGFDLYYVDGQSDGVSVAVKNKDDLQFLKDTFLRKMYVTREYEKNGMVIPVRGSKSISDRTKISYLDARVVG